MMNTCIFCKTDYEKQSIEHIIPNVVTGKQSESPKLKNGICKTCNNKYGHTIDSDFLNHDLIKLIRLRNYRFTQKSKIPHFKKSKKIMD